jgi:hypothetical protein
MIFQVWSYANGVQLVGWTGSGYAFKGSMPSAFNPELTSKDCCLLHGDETIWMILVSY